MNLNVRKGDNVIVLTGKDKGKTGKVLTADPDTGFVTVENVNMVTCHIKPTSAQQQGGKVQKEGNIHSSNVQIICPNCSKSARVRHSEVEGKKARVCAKCGGSLDAALKVDKASKKKSVVKAKKASKKEEAAAKLEPTKQNSKASGLRRSMNKESSDGR